VTLSRSGTVYWWGRALRKWEWRAWAGSKMWRVYKGLERTEWKRVRSARSHSSDRSNGGKAGLLECEGCLSHPGPCHPGPGPIKVHNTHLENYYYISHTSRPSSFVLHFRLSPLCIYCSDHREWFYRPTSNCYISL